VEDSRHHPRTRALPALVALAAALAAGSFAAPVANAQEAIYWTSLTQYPGSPVLGTVARANIDGTGVDTVFIPGGRRTPTEVFVGADRIYWIGGDGSGTADISRTDIDGTNTIDEFIGNIGAQSVTADTSHIFWGTPGLAATIGRANLDVTGIEPTFITGADNVTDVAVNAGNLFWTNQTGGTIGRANLDGSAPNRNFIDVTGPSQPSGLALNSTHVFWSDCLNGTIGRATLAGGDVDNTFISGVGACDVAVDGAHVYWLRPGVDGGNIGRADLDGDPASVIGAFIVDPNAYGGLALGPKRDPLFADATHIGTAGPDVIVGTEGDDVIYALGGNDVVRALGGEDVVHGGDGADRLKGQSARDRLLGDAGKDTLAGGSGRDVLRGGPGRDRLNGGPGKDSERQ
jgi:Ca2+-binding RTX toxin-like protein